MPSWNVLCLVRLVIQGLTHLNVDLTIVIETYAYEGYFKKFNLIYLRLALKCK